MGSSSGSLNSRYCSRPRLRDRDWVQGAVELAVAAAVEPVAPVLAGAGFERCDAGVAGKLRVCLEAFDRSDLAEQTGPSFESRRAH